MRGHLPWQPPLRRCRSCSARWVGRAFPVVGGPCCSSGAWAAGRLAFVAVGGLWAGVLVWWWAVRSAFTAMAAQRGVRAGGLQHRASIGYLLAMNN